MLQDRKEPTFSPTSNKASHSSVEAQADTPVKVDAPPQLMIQKQSSVLLSIVLFIALLAASASAYVFWQFTLSQQIIAEQQKRLLGLEDKLLLSDDESSQSLSALTANVKGLDKNVSVAMSEVDKLWATRNTNLKKLTAVKIELNSLINKMGKRIDTSNQQSKEIIANIDVELKKRLVTIRQNSSEQELLLASLREKSTEQNQEIDSIRTVLGENTSNTGKVANLEKKLEQSVQQLEALSRRTKEYDEAIESFDKFRLTTNRDLLGLKNRTVKVPQ